MATSQKETEMVAIGKENEAMLTAEWVRENLIYEPDIGVFLWKVATPE